MKEVSVLEVKFDSGNITNAIYPVILTDGQEMILIDCGYPGFAPLIKAAAETEGIAFDRLTKIIITHHDFDHVGALAALKSDYPKIQILASTEEERYISGKEKSLRLQQAEALYDSLPEDEKANAEKFHQLLRSVRTTDVDLLLKDHDQFPWCGGVEIIATPGHMPGHISIYLRKYKTLIAGDALVVENNELEIANPQYTLDIEEAKNSIKKLLEYEIEKVICYHGGVYTQNSKESLHKLL